MSDTKACGCIIVAGKVGSGKTTAIRALAGALAAGGCRVAGVLQPDLGRGERGGARGFSLELAASAPDGSGALDTRSLPLARENPDGDAPGPGQLAHGRYLFELGSFAAACDFLRGLLERRTGSAAPDLVFLDEIGKLELERREGLRPCLDLVLAACGNAGRGPRLLVLAARDLNAAPLRAVVEEAGMVVSAISLPEGRESILPAARALLSRTL